MSIETQQHELLSADNAAQLLASWDIVDHARGWANLVAIREQGLSWGFVGESLRAAFKHLPRA